MKLFYYRFLDFFRFLFLNKIFKEFVIYSEGQNYRNYYYQIIEILTKKFNKKITYVSSDKNDRIDNNNVKNIYIGSSYIRTIFFAFLSCDKLIMTLTDLGKLLYKKI